MTAHWNAITRKTISAGDVEGNPFARVSLLLVQGHEALDTSDRSINEGVLQESG